MEGRTENFTPRGPPWEQNSSLGGNFAPRGEVKNGSQAETAFLQREVRVEAAAALLGADRPVLPADRMRRAPCRRGQARPRLLDHPSTPGPGLLDHLVPN
jgi:hypothetical protein